MNKTETKFKKICDKNNWFSIKLNTHNINGFGYDQVSDFLVANNNGVYVIECKERKGKYFYLKDLTQSLQMKKLIKKSNRLKPYILLNYYEYNKLYLFSFQSLEIIKLNNKFSNGKIKKGFNYKDIPNGYLIDWNDINKVL